MAQTNFTPISLYYSATSTNVPTAGNLVAGELAINTADGKIFYKDSSGVVQTIASKSATAGTYSSITTSNLTIGTTQLGAGNASIMKNRIINGAMVIDQRNAGASVSTSSGGAVYTLDRWQAQYSQTSKYTVQQNAGSVTAPVGFTNYLGVTSSSAYSVTSGDYFLIAQKIEGFNWADLNWGTANAKTITLSFWVRSSLTGTFGGSLCASGDSPCYPFSYTISSANTWTQTSITIAGPTTGTWLTTTGIGAVLYLSLGAGSTYSGTAGSWGTTAYYGVTGQQQVVGTSGATFYITGVQLEVGSSATGFEYVNYQTSLANCQRYYYLLVKGAAGQLPIMNGCYYSSTDMRGILQYKVTMRTTPTISSTTGTNYYRFNRNSTADDFNSLDLNDASPDGVVLYNNTEMSGTAGQAGWVLTNNSSAFVAFQAEL
jgi:hypothetical protein